MINVSVGTNYLASLMETGRATFGSQVRGDIDQLQKDCLKTTYITVAEKDELRKHSVYDLLDKHFRHLKTIVPSDILKVIRNEIEETGRRDYHFPNFQATQANAENCLAMHQILPHGLITGMATRGYPEEDHVFLPDLALGRSFWGFLGRSVESQVSVLAKLEMWVFDFDRLNCGDGDLPNDLAGLQCHLCDSLESVYDRALRAHDYLNRRFDELTRDGWPCSEFDSLPFFDWNRAPKVFTIDPVVTGFQNYRIFRRANPDVPPIASHRLLSRSAVRQGFGMPVVSSYFPSVLWRSFDPPVKHFVLSAAEQAGSQNCCPIYPDTPSRKEMDSLITGMESLLKSSVTDHYAPNSSEVGAMIPILEKLGLAEAFRKLQLSPSASDISETMPGFGILNELRSAMIGTDIERSLHLQDIYDLYPLHKRVLGLIEYLILPKLSEHGFAGKASQLWTNGFLEEVTDEKGKLHKGPLSAHPQKEALNHLATLETEGNWLILAAQHEVAGRSEPLALADLLDELVERRITKAPETGGTNCYLQPPTAGDQARQLADLAGLTAADKAEELFRQTRESHGTVSLEITYRGCQAPDAAALADRFREDAACTTLYLGKLVLMLRNAIEHGTDRDWGNGLLLDCGHYWVQPRGRRPVVDWLNEKAHNPPWRATASLPRAVPNSANALVLSPASLQRCLVLLSLVLHAARSQLDI
jgi:hypothetical protein